MSLSVSDVQKSTRIALIIQGILALVIGIVMLVWPGPSVIVFVALFAAWLFIDGLFSIIGWATRRRENRSAWSLVRGILAIIVAVIAVFLPAAAAVAIVVVVGIWAIVLGVVQIATSLAFKRVDAPLWWVPLVTGILGIIIGILLLLNPAAGIISLLWLVALFLIIEGIAAILLGIMSRRQR